MFCSSAFFFSSDTTPESRSNESDALRQSAKRSEVRKERREEEGIRNGVVLHVSSTLREGEESVKE